MKPLEGVTVLEFSTMITAALAAMMMAEQGARVIKVEPIDMGDPMRYIGTSKGGISSLFANCNRGKESIRVDIKTEAGQAMLSDLISDVDVVIHNFRPGVMDKLNLGSEKLRGLNPKLIYMAISGFGHQGPLSAAPAYDPVIQAHTGMTAAQGTDAPEFIRSLMCDKLTGYTACQAVTSALYMRERTQVGQHIDLSMLDAGLFFMFPDAYQNHTLLDDDIEDQPLLTDLMYQLTQTSDGGITMSAATDKQRAGVLSAVGMEHLMQDDRFNTMEALFANMDAYRAILSDTFLAMTTDQALQKLQANDVPCAKCHTLDEALSQEQLLANESLQVQDHPLMGAVRMMKSPARFGGEVSQPGNPCPAHGEHTHSALKSFGVSADRLDVLTSTGVIS